MPYSTNIQLGSSGQIFTFENGNLYLAFNDNNYFDNTGKFIFDLYLSGDLVGSKQINGNYHNWQLSFGLLGGKTYNYITSGLINNGNNLWGSDGWVGHNGDTVSDQYGSSAQRYSFSSSVPNSPYIVKEGSFANPFNYQSILIINDDGPRAMDNKLIIDEINIPTSPRSDYSIIDTYQYPSTIEANQSLSYQIINDNGGYGGGEFTATFQSTENQNYDFLAPELVAYSMIGQFVGLSSPLMCYNIVSYNTISTGLPTGSGFIPPFGYVPLVTGKPNSGTIFLSIENKISACLDEIKNKIIEFKINSFYPNDKNLDINFGFKDPKSSFANYLSFTQDEGYLIVYTGYVTATQSTPTTNITGYIETYQNLSGLVPLYTTGIDSGVQICYISGLTGVLTGSGTGFLARYFGQELTGLIINNSGYIQYDSYQFQSGTGVITEIISGFDPQMFVYKDGVAIAYNDDWKNNQYVNEIRTLTVGRNITLPYIEAANIFNIVGGTGFSVNISKSPKYSPQNQGFVRKKSTTVSLVQDSGFRYNTYTAPLASWASYDVSSGTNSKNVIAYAIEIIDDLILSGQKVINTGELRGLPPDIIVTGSDIRSEYIVYCLVGKELKCKDKEINDIGVCFTGDPNSSQYNSFVNGILKKFKSSALTEYDPVGLLSVTTGVIPSYFHLWSGHLDFNTFVSGDSLVFDLYPFDYTGLYQRYFYDDPTHPSTGLTLLYPRDFTDITSLTDAININLSGITYPVWYPYDCVSGSGQQGIYVSDKGLLGAQIRQLDTGDVNYNNIIDFYSLRNNTGYSLNLNLVQRAITGINDDSKLKYLLPSYISLQGSNDNSIWTNLDIQTSVDWLSIEPTQKQFTGLKSGIPDNLTIINVSVEDDEEEIFITEVDSEGGYQTLYSFIQSGQVSTGPDCSPQSFSREVSIIKPTGFPPGTKFDDKTCGPTGKEEKEKGEKESPASGTSGKNPLEELYVANYLRTGWVLEESFVGQPITGINYNYYRLYLSGFEGNNYNYETITNTFIINNVNLYSCLPNSISAYTGGAFCPIGADYTLQVEGHVPVQLSGLLEESIDISDSGLFNINNRSVLMEISNLNSGDLVRFNKLSGRLISNSGTGFITDAIVGTGCFTSGIVDWFYNPSNNTVFFDQVITGCITGSGKFSGEYIRLKPSVVNQQLAQGGFLNSVFGVSVFTGVTFTGLANSKVLLENLAGIYNYTGITGGYAALGYFELNSGINFLLNHDPVDYVAGGTTGYENSRAILSYGIPQDFDWISINNVSISYNSDSGSWIPPDYFSTSGQLLNIINSNLSSFFVTGYIENGLVVLESILSGEIGNNITVSAGRGLNTGDDTPYFNSNNLTGGRDLYMKIYGTGIYSGYLSMLLYNTGYYTSSSGSGSITGYVSTYQGTRDFTGVWQLITGNFFTGYNDFLENGFTGDNAYSYLNTIGGTNYAITPQNIDMGLFYNDLFDTQSNTDVAKLTISGINLSGVSKLISGISELLI